MKENNILLAEFLGYVDNGCSENGFLIDPNTNYDIEIENLKFHTSWDWLMLVVDKIESLGLGQRTFTVRISYDICSIDFTNLKERGETPLIFKRSVHPRNKIEATYNACIQFVKWYNSQNK